jgi:hypothetical protein
MSTLSHHSAKYNAARIIEELLLLEDHHVKDRCIECITKHYLRVKAYAIEGQQLPNHDVHESLKKAAELAERHIKEVHGALHGAQPDAWKLASEVRSLRKELVEKVYGVAELEDHHHVH